MYREVFKLIKPVKRNKRLKWKESRYSYKYRMDNFINASINAVATDWCVPVNRILGKSPLHDIYESLDRLKQ